MGILQIRIIKDDTNYKFYEHINLFSYYGIIINLGTLNTVAVAVKLIQNKVYIQKS